MDGDESHDGIPARRPEGPAGARRDGDRAARGGLLREGIRLAPARYQPSSPTIPILVSADPHFAERVDDHLTGFGER